MDYRKELKDMSPAERSLVAGYSEVSTETIRKYWGGSEPTPANTKLIKQAVDKVLKGRKS